MSSSAMQLRMRPALRARPFGTARPAVRPSRPLLPLRAAEKQEVDLEAQVELFMKRQAELESGAAFARTSDPERVIGSDVVNDEKAKQMCAEVYETLRTLKTNRDMSVNEVKLVIAIEDPRMRERRMQGLEDERGVSRDEMAVALQDVAEGRVPKDRIALRCLYEEMAEWPFLDGPLPQQAGASASASTSGSAAAPSSTPAADGSKYESLLGGDTVVKPYIMGNEARKGDKPQGIADMLPDWVGYGALYGISAIPVLIVIAMVTVLFLNSLK